MGFLLSALNPQHSYSIRRAVRIGRTG